MDGRELVICVSIVEENEQEDYLAVEFWDEKIGDSSILRYIKVCHEMNCYKNGAYLIIHKDKDTEIRVCTDVYIDSLGSLWVKARDITQDYETKRTRVLNCIEQVIDSNKGVGL